LVESESPLEIAFDVAFEGAVGVNGRLGELPPEHPAAAMENAARIGRNGLVALMVGPLS
jgi:hypothetical protein